MSQYKNFAKSFYVDTFFPNSGSAAASGFITAFAVVARVAAAEPELEKKCINIRTFGKVLMLTHFLKVLMLHHVL